MSRFVRPSKYRHTYSQQGRKENNYENLKVSSSAWDTDLIQANHKFLSINYQASGGGAFSILPLLSPFTSITPLPTPRLPDLIPLCRGHSAPVLDTAWDPHQQAILASAGEDGKILIWNFDDELSNSSQGTETYSGKFSGWGEEKWTCPSDFTHTASISKAGNGRKVGQVVYNPSANGILASASGDHMVRIWDTDSRGSGMDSAVIELKGHRDTIQSLTWNYTGDLIITTSRDKKIRMYDPRASTSPIKEADGHGGIKGSRVVWLGDRDRAVTTGFSRMSDRQMILWDTKNLVPINTETIDSSSGVIMPHYIEGNSVLLLAGKGDGNIRFFEYADDELFYLNEHKSVDPQRGFTLLPRHAVDIGQNEIARGFKLTTSTVEPLGFVVPRKAENFQADIFPPAPGLEPAFSAKEWVDGKTGPPKLIDLESRATAAYQPPAQSEKKASTSEDAAPARSSSTPSTPAAATPAPTAAAVEYSKDTPVLSATAIPETVKTPTEFNPRNLEIKQDDPDSDDEEMTEAKKRAPTDDDEFADEAKPSIVDVSGGGKSVQDEQKKEDKVESPAVTPAATPAVVEKQSTPAKESGDDKELAAVRAELAETKKQLETLRAENAKYKSSFSAMKKALAELS